MNKKDINSNDLNRAMLKAQLSGNEIKVILAYISKGAWKYGTECFLPESVRDEYGLSNSTVKRVRKGLVDKGWMKKTGNTSKWGCDMYTIHIPAEIEVVRSEPAKGSNLNQGVGQNEPGGGSFWSTEVTKEVTKRSNEVSNKVEGSALRASHDSADAPSSTFSSNNQNKDDQDYFGAPRRLDDSLIGPYVSVPEPVLIGATKERGVVQNDLPSDLYDAKGELLW